MALREHFPLTVAAWSRLKAAVGDWCNDHPALTVMAYMVACVTVIDTVIFVVDLVRESLP